MFIIRIPFMIPYDFIEKEVVMCVCGEPFLSIELKTVEMLDITLEFLKCRIVYNKLLTIYTDRHIYILVGKKTLPTKLEFIFLGFYIIFNFI